MTMVMIIIIMIMITIIILCYTRKVFCFPALISCMIPHDRLRLDIYPSFVERTFENISSSLVA